MTGLTSKKTCRRFTIASVIALAIAGMAGCSDQGLPVQPSSTVLRADISTSDAECTECVLGPLVLERSKGAPDMHSFPVDAGPDGDYLLQLSSLTGKGTTVDVMLNGALIAEFRSGENPTAEYSLQLVETNTVTFRLAGKPGSRVAVRIVGPPPPLVTVFEGPIVGVSLAEVEAACKATPLPTVNDSYYVIRQLERLIVSRVFEEPWPGRTNADVHARQTATLGKLRFSCTQRNRDGSSGSQFVVELGEETQEVTLDVKVCEANGQGGSQATSINTGQLACPYAFGNIFAPHPDYFNAGPYTPVEEVVTGPPMCTIFRPSVLGEGGRKHPIILWASGITLDPTWYRGLLRHFASHGFVVAAADTSRVGTAANGQNLLACLQYVESQNAPGGAYANKLNIYRVGAAGHSAGGAGVIMAGRDPRITATAPVQPGAGLFSGADPAAPGQQNGPMFLSSGELDTQVSYSHVQSVYTNANVPIFWGHRLGSGHNDPLFDAPSYRRPLTAWFRFNLMLDVPAGTLFYGANCQLCVNPVWVVQRKNGIQ